MVTRRICRCNIRQKTFLLTGGKTATEVISYFVFSISVFSYFRFSYFRCFYFLFCGPIISTFLRRSEILLLEQYSQRSQRVYNLECRFVTMICEEKHCKTLQDSNRNGRLSHRPPDCGFFAMCNRLHCFAVADPDVQIFLKYGPEGGFPIGLVETWRIKLE